MKDTFPLNGIIDVNLWKKPFDKLCSLKNIDICLKLLIRDDGGTCEK